MIPDDLRYTAEHEWVKSVGDDVVRVGITHFAQDALGDIVFVQLPDVGAAVTAGESCGEVESTKSVSDLYAPLSGEVTSTNGTLESAPETVNTDPYDAGWMFEITLSDPAQLDGLMDAAAYAEHVAAQ